jgi:hypothetical protein
MGYLLCLSLIRCCDSCKIHIISKTLCKHNPIVKFKLRYNHCSSGDTTISIMSRVTFTNKYHWINSVSTAFFSITMVFGWNFKLHQLTNLLLAKENSVFQIIVGNYTLHSILTTWYRTYLLQFTNTSIDHWYFLCFYHCWLTFNQHGNTAEHSVAKLSPNISFISSIFLIWRKRKSISKWIQS